MDSIVLYDEIDKWIVEQDSLDHEIEQISQFYRISATMREIANYKMYRAYLNKTWLDKFESGAKFIEFMCEANGVSQRTIYERIKVYDIMQWLGIDYHDAIHKMCDKPSLYMQTLQLLIKDWNFETHQPGTVKLPDSSELSEPEVKIKMLELLDDGNTYEKQYEAIDHIKQDVLGQPLVSLYIEDEDILAAKYESVEYLPDGTRTIAEAGIVKWYPSGEVPDFVLDAFKRRVEKR